LDLLVENGIATGDGGCIWAESDVTFTRTILSDCISLSGDGGGLWVAGDFDADDGSAIEFGDALRGGAVFAGPGSVVQLGAAVLLYANTASAGGGGAWMEGPSWSGGVFDLNVSGADGGGMVLVDSTLSDATFTANQADGNGGGVYGSSEIVGVVLESNTAVNAGGGVYADAVISIDSSSMRLNHADGRGGGVYAAEAGTLIGSDVTANSALQDGGGVYAVDSLDLSGVIVVDGNATEGGDGGGIWLGGALTQTDGPVVTNNTAVNGGGLYAVRADPDPDLVLPQQAELEDLDLTGLVLDGNTATGSGGALFTAYFDVLGLNAVNNHSDGDGGGVRADWTWLVDAVLDGNSAGDDGGGALLASSTLIDPIVTANTAVGDGGGVASDGLTHMNLDLRGGSIEGNEAGGNGGGVWYAGMGYFGLEVDGGSIADNTAVLGGGIFLGGALAFLGVDSISYVASNPVSITGNGADSGGGLYTTATCPVGALCPANLKDLYMTAATLEANSATFDGGGAYLGGTSFLERNQIADNDAGGSGGGIACAGSCSATGTASTFDGNVAGDLGGALWADSAYYQENGGGSFVSNTALRGGALAISGVNEVPPSGIALIGCDLSNNALLAGGDGGMAYLDGSIDESVRITFNTTTWAGNPLPMVEWIDLTGANGIATLTSGTTHICTPGGGCP
jgi:predicted outer membrane repeat protein